MKMPAPQGGGAGMALCLRAKRYGAVLSRRKPRSSRRESGAPASRYAERPLLAWPLHQFPQALGDLLDPQIERFADAYCVYRALINGPVGRAHLKFPSENQGKLHAETIG